MPCCARPAWTWARWTTSAAPADAGLALRLPAARQERAMRWIRRAGWTVLALALLGTLLLWGYTRRASPQVDGEMVLEGVSAPVRVERDAHGIPTIRAQTMPD